MTEFGLLMCLCCILLCLFVVLVERKFLAHAQRRFGPSIAGRNGWLQIILDLIKLATKEVFIVANVLTSLVPMFIALFFIIQLLFIQNFIFGPSLFLFFNLDGLIFYHLILVMLSNIVLLCIGFLSQSKYSLLGTFRAVIHIITLDTVVTVVYILLILNTNSGSFHDFVITQLTYYFIIIFSPLSILFLMIMLLEAKRAPFDHIETESEVVSGYATEYSSIYLLTFYLIEYFHLIISANHFTICFLGGWVINFYWIYFPTLFYNFHLLLYL